MSNSVVSDETAHHEPSHLKLRCSPQPFIIAVAVKELKASLNSKLLSKIKKKQLLIWIPECFYLLQIKTFRYPNQ